MNSNFAAGDVLLSSRCSLSSTLIRLGTMSRFSHAAIILDESGLVLEAVPREKDGKESDSPSQRFGVRIQTLNEFMAHNDRVWLLRRPSNLNQEKAIRLKRAGLAYEGQKYDKASAMASGLTRFAVILLALAAALLAWKLTVVGPQPILIALETALVLPALLLAAAHTRSTSDTIAHALQLPTWLTNDSQAQFCSRLVCDVYNTFGEPLTTYDREPRPKDLSRALKAKGFVATRLKPSGR